MLSEKVNALCAQIMDLQEQLDAEITKETEGLLSVCKFSWIQLYAEPAISGDKEAIERLVGPLTLTGQSTGADHFDFALGTTRGVVLLRTSEQRGGSDDVSIDEEA